MLKINPLRLGALTVLTLAVATAAGVSAAPPAAGGARTQIQIAPPSAESPTLAELRKQAAHRPRRIILNNDGDDSLASRKDRPPVVDQFLQLQTAPLVGSQVDTIFYCSIRCFGSVLHRTDVAENLTTHLKGSFPNSLMSGLLSQGTEPSRSCSSSATPRKSRSSARCA